MPWSIYLDPHPLDDPAYDTYRDQDRVGAIIDDDGHDVGYVVIYLADIDQFVGRRGLRPVWQPTEQLKAVLEAPGRYPDYAWPTPEELDTGRIEGFQIRWLSGDARRDVWQRYLDDWGPPERSRWSGDRPDPA
ncbi:hypothetical protein GCM10011575_31170 [Microlunatus endophyticus]|uniref:Uncharacterized protein n=1 Tax=Microlunatus endophyticus TaxID=1716077 RepID=A0A917SDF2_9ACTN|nr:hypothetical protein [Microlunatus endophyticus]GGL70475.1 hypothetical protein GCM10011575_31170 [Microlunatus endophyticus]